MITLTAGRAKVQVIPRMGGGLAGAWVGDVPVLRPWLGQEGDGPFALACNLLVPFSNRISAAFPSAGQHHPIAPNLPGEVFPIHGDGFQRPWQVTDHGLAHAVLALPDGKIGPFRHAAQVGYHLTATALETRLSVTNRGAEALPFGLGLHPWFPRDADTRLQFLAKGEWPETANHLPATRSPQPLDGGPWHSPAPLPEGWINMGFSGWDGRAEITQGPRAVSVTLAAQGLGTALIYSPSAQADFFCFEPVSHPVDAHNLPGQPGLVRLAPGESLHASITMTWGATP